MSFGTFANVLEFDFVSLGRLLEMSIKTHGMMAVFVFVFSMLKIHMAFVLF